MLPIVTLEKRTSENIWYDIDCTNILDAAELIASITSIAGDQTGLTFTGQQVNTVAINYPDGTTGAIGKVIMVQISGGTIPVGQTVNPYTVRAIFFTNEGNTREATVILNIINSPIKLQY
jgi:hypothetical protein